MVNPAPSPQISPSVPLLREIRLFRKFSPAELTQLIRLGTTHTFEAHTNIIIEGELSWGLYLVLDGRATVFKTNKSTGETHALAQLKEGASFGEMSLLDESPRSATVRAVAECRLFHISKDAFIAFMNESQERQLRFYENCVHDLVTRLRDLDDSYAITQYQLWKAVIRKEAA